MKLSPTLLGLFLIAQAGQPSSEPAVVLSAEKAWAGADVLWPLATSGDPAVSQFAVRAIGRLEDPGNVPRLLALAQQPGVDPAAIGHAIAQSLNGFEPARDPPLVASVSAWLRRVTLIDTPKLKNVMPLPIGRIHYGNAAQVHAAEAALVRTLQWAASDRSRAALYLGAVQGLESLARLNAKITTFDPGTVSRLSRIVAHTDTNDGDDARENALAALIAARGLAGGTELVALRDSFAQVRRLAAVALAGAGAGLDDETRINLIQATLADRDGQVRYEAVKGFVRHAAKARGCGPLLDLVADRDTHVALAAIDALGDVCRDDEDVTARILAEARPPVGAAWHRGAHAFVALSKRAPDRAAPSMEAFVTHPSWWVRMYAARAAAAAGDVPRLGQLAYDANDNVREAALSPLRRLTKADADAAIVAALDRADVQLLRTAATLLQDSSRSSRTARALIAALLRLTKEGKETSRDARVPLLEALAIHAGPDNAPELQPLLKDFDPVVAGKVASLLSQLTGKPAMAGPLHVSRGWPQQFPDLRRCVTVSLASGRSFGLRMDPEAAPVTVDRFLTLALVDRYYDGLTIHRVAPNFVIQGGSPGANEYAGHREFMRDEIGARNSRGTAGLSTRGRNTADAQFYINLIDNPRLDADYTVFASVFPADMGAVDAIQEGEIMRAISPARCTGR